MGDDGGVVAGGPRELATVASLLLQVAHNGSLQRFYVYLPRVPTPIGQYCDSHLRHVADGHDVADGKVSLLATVHKLSGVHA